MDDEELHASALHRERREAIAERDARIRELEALVARQRYLLARARYGYADGRQGRCAECLTVLNENPSLDEHTSACLWGEIGRVLAALPPVAT